MTAVPFASALATEMAIGCRPPKLGVAIRNLALALEFLYDHPLHLHLLAGPDYSAAMVGPTNPSLLDRAKQAPAPGHDRHGYATMGELMEDLNPLSGRLVPGLSARVEIDLESGS